MKSNLFVIIGAQRSGTTFLYSILNEHPQIEMASPVKPEPKFFLKEEEFSKGKNFYLQKYFPDKASQKIFGEKSTSYIENIQAGERMIRMFPEVKIIAIIRNPVDRALSNYHFSVKNKIETRSLRDVFIDKKNPPDTIGDFSVSPFDYLARGLYLRYLEKYFRLFSKKNIKVLVFEKLIGNITAIQNLYSFLEVSADFVPHNIVEKVNSSESKEVPDNEVICTLQEYYRPTVKPLENFLDENLSIWKF